MEKCPYPTCCHIGAIITKTHCRIEHQMDRSELFNKYDKPKRIANRNTFIMGKESRYASGTVYKTNF